LLFEQVLVFGFPARILVDIGLYQFPVIAACDQRSIELAFIVVATPLEQNASTRFDLLSKLVKNFLPVTGLSHRLVNVHYKVAEIVTFHHLLRSGKPLSHMQKIAFTLILSGGPGNFYSNILAHARPDFHLQDVVIEQKNEPGRVYQRYCVFEVDDTISLQSFQCYHHSSASANLIILNFVK